ncbi:MAG TPA: hypothetical protein VGF95_14265 [Solirubrobacteraceae bacterium]
MSVVHHQIADELREAGDDGVAETEVALIAGRWWATRLEEMSAHGYTVARENEHVYLIAERDVERRCETAGPLLPAARQPVETAHPLSSGDCKDSPPSQSGAAASLNATLPIDDLRLPTAYSEDM